jgi:hypothetical protein
MLEKDQGNAAPACIPIHILNAVGGVDGLV